MAIYQPFLPGHGLSIEKRAKTIRNSFAVGQMTIDQLEEMVLEHLRVAVQETRELTCNKVD